MIVGTAILELHLPGVRSLKEKRGRLKSLIAQLHKKFNISAAEVDLHDVWQSATVGVCVVSTSPHHAVHVLDNLRDWIIDYRPDIDLIEESIETIHL